MLDLSSQVKEAVPLYYAEPLTDWLMDLARCPRIPSDHGVGLGVCPERVARGPGLFQETLTERQLPGNGRSFWDSERQPSFAAQEDSHPRCMQME
ncbi:uncharacterized protein ACIQIH_015917 isoform 1-T1 [Cyanocitta cristata]